MAKKIRKSRKTSKPVEAATTSVPAEAPQVERATADQIATGTVVSARAAAIRRSTEGKFNKQVLSAIGGKECPRFYPMTWKERDAFMAKPEGAPVRERYKAHLKSVGK